MIAFLIKNALIYENSAKFAPTLNRLHENQY